MFASNENKQLFPTKILMTQGTIPRYIIIKYLGTNIQTSLFLQQRSEDLFFKRFKTMYLWSRIHNQNAVGNRMFIIKAKSILYKKNPKVQSSPLTWNESVYQIYPRN